MPRSRPSWIRPIVWIGALGALTSAALGACKGHQEGNRREVASDDCVVCHRPEYEATTMPPHPGLFSEECADCHGIEAWVPALPLDHEWFVLRNRHAEIRCADCHTVGYREGDTPTACVGCHRADYDMAEMPPHANYPTDCASCHTDAGWVPSTFSHPWPLTGAHELAACTSCHTGEPPTWAGLPRECVGCHRDDYDMSPYPGHETFPTTCADCHSTTGWTPALEGAHPEDRFPVQNGPHQPFECTSCHDPARGTSVAGMNTDCVGCHHEGVHSRARMDDKHREEPDYPFETTSVNFCLDCHPDGRN
jgi:hypothetical protein